MKRNQHVVLKGSKWAVKDTTRTEPTAFFATQSEAIKFAETEAKKYSSDTKIHGRDGKIRAGNSYGNDPCPPKDSK
ncbi:MAG: DUF2188 domain-containing protein [Burkholderiales bacterium]|nr:DUF2188 domain-containing protein [Burkholderiales bacterium]